MDDEDFLDLTWRAICNLTDARYAYMNSLIPTNDVEAYRAKAAEGCIDGSNLSDLAFALLPAPERREVSGG